jgi:hypothetical protein
MREHDEALAQLRADRKLNQLLARQEAERASAFFDPPPSIAPDRLWPGVHSEPFVPLNYLSAPFNPPNDTGFDPSDDWQKRGRDTAAAALSIPYAKDGPIPVAANQPSNVGNGLQPIPAGQLWAGVQPAPLTALNYTRNTLAQPPAPVRAYPWRDSVIYDYPDGSEDVYQGGTAAWRFNNPGNIENGRYAANHGAIGGNRFAAFPDQKTGADAQVALLQDRYGHLTLDDAIAKYAPPNENRTAKYQSFVRGRLGLPGTTPLAGFTAAQMQALAESMRIFEGFEVGTTRHLRAR